MSNVRVNFNKLCGIIKPMHAVNNGPCVAGKDQTRGNQDYYKLARIPYARVHDASFYAGYGGEHTVDVHAIFPNFDADVNDEASYDFDCTDHYLAQIFQYGSAPFYRLGSKIEHGVKKYGTIMPKSFQKWAEICEHIILHYTQGWANGFNYNIEYWEIWNEPDLDPDDSTNKRCWSGTEAEFAEFYRISATYLKSRFPHLKIGGPASAGDEEWMKRFLDRIKTTNTPLDFFSWHWYWTQPTDMSIKGTRIRKLLDDAGYKNTESILNEWNYVRCWTKEFIYTIEQIISIKGACFTSACMSAGQSNPGIDMLMYYDARPGTFNGLFDFYTMRPLKGYYPFYLYSNLFELGTHVYSESDDENIYVVGAKSDTGKGVLITYYAEDDNLGIKDICVDLGNVDINGAKLFLIDKDNTMAQHPLSSFVNDGVITLKLLRNSIVYIEL
ncbi:MAG: hypothetical protein J6B34_05300 [Clostridia bacterium]|nr:hypothetical protein [Clostridia bacterium]